MMYFLDFDRTLFDTEAFKTYLKSHESFASLWSDEELELAHALNTMVEKGEASFARGELSQFLFPEVAEWLTRHTESVTILTFGNPALQKAKVESALPDIAVPALYTGHERKGPFMRERILSYSDATLVDDTPLELELMNKECPSVSCVEMRRDGELGDGRWPVVHSLTELS